MVTKISIIGVAKSGTSALYSSIKSSLPAPRRILFEPNNATELAYVTAGRDENALTKVMFSALERQNYDPSLFTHRVAIVRDPRDTIISSTLFRFNRLKLLNNKQLFSHLLSLFEQKEADPLSISVHDILEAAEIGEAEALKKKFNILLGNYGQYLDHADQHVISFDQMVAGDFDKLNAYLGLTLSPPPPLEGWVGKISRKGTSGDWKNWFTPEDVAFFRDSMDGFINKYGFDSEWRLEAKPMIEPKYCSQYIQRLSEARKVDPNLKSDVGSDMASLLSAAEDSKVNALMKLVDVYAGDGLEADREKAIGLSLQLGAMGYPKYFIRAARLHLKSKERERAIEILKEGIACNYPPAYFMLGNQFLGANNLAQKADGIKLLEQGRDLGSENCAKKLAELKA